MRVALGAAMLGTLTMGVGSPTWTSASARTESVAAVTAVDVTPFYAVDRVRIPLPEGVMPWGPTWSADGERIYFQDYHHVGEWVVDADGGNPRCITCAMADRPDVAAGFAYAFPDEKRLWISAEIEARAWVLECAPSLVDCQSHQWLPVDFSADNAPTRLTVGRRTFHLAPDGQHLGYTLMRLDGLLMVVGRLERGATSYRVTDPRVVNPRGPSGPLDPDIDAWTRGSALYELKSFVDGGRKVLAMTDEYGAAEQVEIDLATGAMRRLATSPDWNEDGSVSPDQSLLLTASWRTQHRLTPLSVLPAPFRPAPLVGVFGAVGNYYVSSRAGFSCDLQPWLLPAEGDAGGALVGQPLNPYEGGTEVGANNLAGQQVWSPDSTRVLLQPRLIVPVPADANTYLAHKGAAPSALVVAEIARPATVPTPVTSSAVGAWAPTPQEFTSSNDYPGVQRLAGKRGGSVVLAHVGSAAGGAYYAVFSKYSDDGRYFVSGRVSRVGTPVALDRFNATLKVVDRDGQQVGSMEAHLGFVATGDQGGAKPPLRMSGRVVTKWEGRTYRGLTKIGPCPGTLPRPTPLSITADSVQIGDGVMVRVEVRADIDGDERAVQGARVWSGDVEAVTDEYGVATLSFPGSVTDVELRATAGDTFESTGVTVDVR